MARLSRRSVLGLALAAAGAACTDKGPTTVTVVLDKMAFGGSPAGLRVGDTIAWVNHDIFQHTATARDGEFDVVLPQGASARTTLKKAGRVDVYCRYHPNMTLTLEVEA